MYHVTLGASIGSLVGTNVETPVKCPVEAGTNLKTRFSADLLPIYKNFDHLEALRGPYYVNSGAISDEMGFLRGSQRYYEQPVTWQRTIGFQH
jgi:hypothetical protein